MRQVILSICLLTFIACNKQPPNLTPAGLAIYKANQAITALSDFQDGVEVGYRAGWLSIKTTYIIAEGIGVALVAIHAEPFGAKKIALDTLADIERRISDTGPEAASKFLPYLDQVRLVLEGL